MLLVYIKEALISDMYCKLNSSCRALGTNRRNSRKKAKFVLKWVTPPQKKLFGSTSSRTDLRLLLFGRTAKTRLAVRASRFTLWPFRKLLRVPFTSIHLTSAQRTPCLKGLPSGSHHWPIPWRRYQTMETGPMWFIVRALSPSKCAGKAAARSSHEVLASRWNK